MVNIIHTQEQNNLRESFDITKVTGCNSDEIIAAVMPLIRPKSRPFYEAEIKKDLAHNGISLVDRHAGQGRYIQITIKAA